MYRLLIVDNEEYVVDGLVELFRQELELEVSGMYSAAEALNALMTTKIDIVLTDIRMPGMNGLELQRMIASRWPHCKVIFLSGYDDFNYAQEAMRSGAVNYILKTEDDSEIVGAVRQAIQMIEEEKEAESVLLQAKQQVKQTLTIMQREYLESVMMGDPMALRLLEKQFEEFHLPLQPNKPVLAVIGKVDEWKPGFSYYDRSLMLYAIQNIANEYLALSAAHYSFVYEKSKIIWLIQTNMGEVWVDPLSTENANNRSSQVVYGIFECIQSSCHDLLQIPLSIAIGRRAECWSKLGDQIDTMRDQLESPVKKQRLITENKDAMEGVPTRVTVLPNDIFKQYEHLNYCLEHKHKEEFQRIFERLIGLGDKAEQSGNSLVSLQIVSSIASSLFAYLDKMNMGALPDPFNNIRNHLQAGKIASWIDQAERLRLISEFVFQNNDEAEQTEENRIVQSIHSFLSANLGNDVSLKTMALAIGHNPSYLSRLYKEKAGKSLSETIAELKLAKAKELLAQPQYRIQDISVAVGFLSDHYFYRFFKKAMLMTPQEYRDKLNKKEYKEC